MGNEKLTMSELVVDINEVQTSALQVAEEAGFIYQRANGTVERATSAEDAIARCPILGKLALEQANVFLELAAIGKSKIEAETQEEQQLFKVEETVEAMQKQPIKSDSEKQIVTSKITEQARKAVPVLLATEQIIEDPSTMKPEAPSHNSTQISKQQVQHNKESHSKNAVTETPAAKSVQSSGSSSQTSHSESNAPSKTETTDLSGERRIETVANLDQSSGVEQLHRQQYESITRRTVATEAIFTQEAIKSSDKNHIKSETIVTSGVVVDNQSNQIEKPLREPDDAAEIAPVELKSEIPEKITAADHAEVFYGADEFSEPLQTLDNHEVVALDNPSQTLESDADDRLDLLFEPETVETYVRLKDLTADLEASEIIVSDYNEIEISSTIVRESTENIDTVDEDFETFLATQPTNEDLLTFETIQEKANAQPLEQTVVQLIEYIANNLPEESEQNAIRHIVQEIKKALPECYVHRGAEDVEPKLQITPEMTEKILTLLRALGYQNPGEALINFVTRYDLAFLLQALEHLCQLNDKENRREFLLSSITSNAIDDTQQRFGKTILSFIVKYADEQVLA